MICSEFISKYRKISKIQHRRNLYIQFFMESQGQIWESREDQILKSLREEEGLTKWSSIAKKMHEQYHLSIRTARECKQRYMLITQKRYEKHLKIKIIDQPWTIQQEQQLFHLHDKIGNKWSLISQKMQGRTDNAIKNHFHSKLRKSIRKLNREIQLCYKKTFRKISMAMLYKIIQGAEDRFNFEINYLERIISQSFCQLKNQLLQYSDDYNSLYAKSPQKVKQMIRQILDFSRKYRKKTRKSKIRKASGQQNDFLGIPRFSSRNVASDEQDDDSSQDSLNLEPYSQKKILLGFQMEPDYQCTLQTCQKMNLLQTVQQQSAKIEQERQPEQRRVIKVKKEKLSYQSEKPFSIKSSNQVNKKSSCFEMIDINSPLILDPTLKHNSFRSESNKSGMEKQNVDMWEKNSILCQSFDHFHNKDVQQIYMDLGEVEIEDDVFQFSLSNK